MGRAYFLPIVVLAIAACSDPYSGLASDPCSLGNTRQGDQACTVPANSAFSADGKTLDWSQIANVPIASHCIVENCPPLPATLQIATIHTSADDWLGVRMTLAGQAAPNRTETTQRYVIEFSALPSHELPVVDAVVANGDGLGYERSRTVVPLGTAGAPDVVWGWTSDGFEVRIPFSLLPFEGGVQIRARIDAVDGTDWMPLSAMDTPAPACWDPNDLRGDPCR